MLFLIALVANCGGLLTPLGDPPLFMLFLRGVPFGWFLTLLPVWATIGAILLALYYLADTYFYRKEEKTDVATEANSVTCRGAQNFIYLVAIVLAVAFINTEHIPLMQENGAPLYIMFLREIVLIIIALLSWFTTSSTTRKENSYSWSSFNEIAILFFGIFVTMTPALIYLRSHASEIGIASESGFYYATGLLSSFLDNTPTAITLYTLAMESNVSGTGAMVAGIPESYLAAISLGAVLFGSMTYIGNGPNFMIKSIAEEDGVKMPGFFGYILQFALPVLLPLFIIIQLLFVN
jgi:Na+/H+ antiporter NhaD/arsenite permease-like protein